MSLEEFDVRLPRHAFSPREAARAGDLWRLLQEVAVIGSSRRAWPPERYRVEQCAFVVRSMTVLHHGEPQFGQPLRARTWVSSFRRGMFSNRQIRVERDGAPVTSATQRWVFVVLPDLKPARAPQALQDAFTVHELEPEAELPEPVEALEGAEHSLDFRAWYTWMDPLAHANHPAYVDWADEAIACVVAENGIDPHRLRSVGETVTFRSGVMAPERVRVLTRLVGQTPSGDAVIDHRVLGHDDRLCAEVRTVRGLVGGDPDALARALR